MALNHTELTEQAHKILNEAVGKLRALGFEGAAPHRLMAWTRFDAICEESSEADARADLARLRALLDKHLDALQ